MAYFKLRGAGYLVETGVSGKQYVLLADPIEVTDPVDVEHFRRKYDLLAEVGGPAGAPVARTLVTDDDVNRAPARSPEVAKAAAEGPLPLEERPRAAPAAPTEGSKDLSPPKETRKRGPSRT